jgi:hypothetical protein
MSLAQSLNLVSETKPNGGSLTVSRRQRLIKAINHQIAQIRDELTGNETLGRRKPTWYWLNEDGVYFVSVKYGKKPVELTKGKYAVQCSSLEDVSASLEVLKEYVGKGDFDEKMEVMAKSIRSNFKR